MKKSNKKAILIIFITIFALCAISFVIYVNTCVSKEIDLSLIKTGASSITKIYYFDYEDRQNRVGQAVEVKDEALFLKRSEWKSIYDMPKNLLDAFVAIEDKRFYEHNGVDWLRTTKAAVNYIFKDKSGFGGSTITQQLIKNLTGDNQVSPKRKIEEIFRAVNLEKKLSKNEILELYLNVVYLSENCYGVNTASEMYFNKNIKDLTLLECACLASIVKSPTRYDPYNNYENNLKRSEIVLNEMLAQGYIDENEYNDALNSKLVINQNIEKEKNSGIYSWYTEALIDDVAKGISDKYDLNYDSAKMMITKGGLNIYSVLDPSIQDKAEEVFENHTAYILPQNGEYPQASCVIIDPYTSDVLAIVGGVGKKNANMILNRATSTKRAPGSVIKPLSVYAPLLEEGLASYATIFDDTPIHLNKIGYWPKNSPNRYRGLMPLSFAVEHSVNTVAVKGLNMLGADKSYDYLTKKFKLTLNEKDKAESPLALGQLTDGESVLNITNAYSAFVNGGFISKPKTYLYVTDNYGNIILENRTDREQILSNSTTKIMTKLLEGVVNNGTAKQLISKNLVSIAGKTGTSGESRDKWFVGYTRDLVCGVWCGFDNPKSIGYSINPACTLFDEIFAKIYKDSTDKNDFDVSRDIIERYFCMDSGKLATQDCYNDIRGSRVKLGYFVCGDEPNEYCTLHKSVVIDTNDGLIADVMTPSFRRRRVSLIDYARAEEFEGINILDSDYFIDSRKRK